MEVSVHDTRGRKERFRWPTRFGLVYWGLTQQQPGSYIGGEMMMMKSVFWWRKPEYPEETTDRHDTSKLHVK